MEARVNSRHLRCVLRIAVLAGAVLTGSGCLPGEEAKSGKSDAASFGFGQGNSNVNRSDKRDPLLDDIADAAQTLFDSPASTASRKSGVETAAYNNGATTSDAAQAGALGAPLVEDIPDIPANVALSRFFSALAKVEAHQPGKTVTILHLGDSHIAATDFPATCGSSSNAGSAMPDAACSCPDFISPKGSN